MEEELFHVEAILEHKEKRGKVYYLCKWEGYPSNENTWELREDLILDGHERAIDKYTSALPDEPTTTGRAKSASAGRARSKTPTKQPAAGRKSPGKRASATARAARDAGEQTSAIARTPSVSRWVVLLAYVVALGASIALTQAHWQRTLNIPLALRPAVSVLPYISSLVVLVAEAQSTYTSRNGLVVLFAFASAVFGSQLLGPSSGAVGMVLDVFLLLVYVCSVRVASIDHAIDVNTVVVSVVFWYVSIRGGGETSALRLGTQFCSDLAVVLALDRLNEKRSVPNALDALALVVSHALLVNHALGDGSLTWLRLVLLTLVPVVFRVE